MQHLSLPKELERFRKDIEATLQPTIKISATTNTPTLFQSKFAGNPYLPKASEHPRDEVGKYMKLLAQINCEELPNKLIDMPLKGILQFFLAGDHDVMGLDFNEQTNQQNFRVVYYDEIVKEDEIITDFSYMNSFGEEYFPIEKELKISFTLENESVSVTDCAFEDSYEKLDFEEHAGVDDDGHEITLFDLYAENLSNEGHKIGGYAFFTQVDPRGYAENYKDYNVLLLQIDSDDENGIMWGDCGVGNFFIRREDLKKLDFTNVLYNWDCH